MIVGTETELYWYRNMGLLETRMFIIRRVIEMGNDINAVHWWRRASWYNAMGLYETRRFIFWNSFLPSGPPGRMKWK